MDIDMIINSFVTASALASGVTPSLLLSRGFSSANSAIVPVIYSPYGRRWLPDEDAFLRARIGKMTDEQIGAAIGRSANAIKIHRIRKGMPAHSKRPGWLTGHGAAKRLGVDIHNIMHLVQRGLIPHEIIPGQKGIIAIKRDWLYRWAVNPMNWIYFKIENVRDAKLRRLIGLEQARWGDEWWTTGQVAGWHGVESQDVERFILAGKLAAGKWGNWRVLRSEAMRPGLYFPKGKGGGHSASSSDEGDVFIILARAVELAL